MVCIVERVGWWGAMAVEEELGDARGTKLQLTHQHRHISVFQQLIGFYWHIPTQQHLCCLHENEKHDHM